MDISELFQIAIQKKASDLHLYVGKPPILRIDGQLEEVKKTSVLIAAEIEKMVFAILTAEQKERFTREKELDFSYQLPGAARFRVNIHYERGNVGLAGRVIKSTLPTMKDIDLTEIVYKLIEMPHGLILVTGPTGCGKSTTLAAMIEHINQTRACHIVTLEDPIEFWFTAAKSIIKQRELGKDMNCFAEGLKHVLRQDPNVIMVGEMRDLETIATTLTLAETGHLVFATLHTYNASQTIDRIIDIFPPYQQTQIRFQMALSLRAVISQQLLPKTGGGRIAAREILINTPAVAHLIRENKVAQIKTVIQTSAKEGMFSFSQDLKRLYRANLVSKEAAEKYLIGLESID